MRAMNKSLSTSQELSDLMQEIEQKGKMVTLATLYCTMFHSKFYGKFESLDTA